MEEDELGLQRAIGHSTLVTCARCGKGISLAQATIVPGSALEDGSDFAYLCPECQQSLAQGEQEAPTTLA